MKYKAVILAAGVGSRLRPITNSVPKCMVQVNGECIIDRQIDSLNMSGVTDILVCAGYKMDVLEKHLLEKYPFVKILKLPEYASTNNMYSMFKTADFARGNDIIVINGDVFIAHNYLDKLIHSKHNNAILIEQKRYEEENMKIICDDNLKISSISKNIPDTMSYGTSIDMYKFSKDFTNKWFDVMNYFINGKNQLQLWNEVGINEMFKFFDVFPVNIGKLWFEIDTLEDLENANKLFEQNNQNKSGINL